MERDGRPILYYLVKRGDSVVIVESTDSEMLAQYEKGARWIGVPFHTRAEAEDTLNKLLR